MSWKSRLRPLLNKVRGTAPTFATQDVEIGRGVRFGRNVRFRSKRVRIGDGCIFRDNVLIEAEDVSFGDFCTIYQDCFFPGPGTLHIGHNFWLGNASIVDAQGGTTIGNNVGIGAHSQLWTHMVYGDVLAGCKFHSSRALVVEDDAWLVGHCLVSPVHVGARSLAMLGSLVTKDMKADHCYAGVPARDITDKVGSQFEPRPLDERASMLEAQLEQWCRSRNVPVPRVSTNPGDLLGSGTSFNVADRTYRKTGTEVERELIRHLLPEAKFVPSS